MKYKYLTLILWVILPLCTTPAILAQQISGDSLTLPQILKTVLESHPSVLKAQEAIVTAEAATELARSGYMPDVVGTATLTRVDPVPSITIPAMGSFQMAPNNNYNVSLGVVQTVFDFDRTGKNIRLQESTKQLSEKNVEYVQQKLTWITSLSYYTLIYLQEAILIKENQILTLQKHLDFVTKKTETGSSTQYEVLSTQVRLSNAVNQKVDLETSRKTQVAILNSLLGLPADHEIRVKSNFMPAQPDVPADSLIQYALDHRSDMALAKIRQHHADLKLETVRLQNYPSLGAFVNAGFKNGYFPELGTIKANWVGGLGLKVPVFDAFRHKNYMKIANADIRMAAGEAEETRRNISTEVYQNQTSLLASLKKIEQSTLQVKQAEEALNLAAISFKSGAITNLDLLDSETALEESRVNLLKARTDYAINVVRLNISCGKPVN